MFKRSADGNNVESKLEEIISHHSEGFDKGLGTLTGLKVKIRMKAEAKNQTVLWHTICGKDKGGTVDVARGGIRMSEPVEFSDWPVPIAPILS